MAAVISVEGVSKSFGTRVLFENVSLAVQSGERLAIIGPNGSGKSTLLSILAGTEETDEGRRVCTRQTTVSCVAQKDVALSDETVEQCWRKHQVDTSAAAEGQALRLLAEAGFTDHQQLVEKLSGGWRKRLAICCGILSQPDALLLDEPTNHLDVEGLIWLENLLLARKQDCVFVSHDRWFLDAVATRIVEINPAYPGGLFQASGNYAEFLERRADFFAGQHKQEEHLANKYRREAEWLRRRPKARATKAVSRIKDADKLKNELSAVKQRNSSHRTVELSFAASGRQANVFIEAEGLAKSFGDNHLFSALELSIAPGDRIGFLGGNGSGKTTLLHILAGSQSADAGTMKQANELRSFMFDQQRESLDQNQSLRHALTENGKTVNFRGQTVYVTAWAKRFLFNAEQLDRPMHSFSGGEQARVLIARLMLQENDVLLLDEPTNDLDIPSLEVLEESLLEFPGAILLISHDRYLMDKVCTGFLALNGKGRADRVADYGQWQACLEKDKTASAVEAAVVSTATTASVQAVPESAGLNWDEQKEYRGIEKKIQTAETKVESIQEELALPENYTNAERCAELTTTLAAAQENLDSLYARWEELETKVGG